MTDNAPTRRSRRLAVPAAPAPMTRAEWRRQQAAQAEARGLEEVAATEIAPVAEAAVPEGQAVDAPAAPAPAAPAVASIADAVVAEAAAAAAALRHNELPPSGEVSTLDANVTTHAVPLTFVAAAAPCDVDEFERAARVLCFTGETPIQTRRATSTVPPAAVHVARRARRFPVKRVATASFSLSVMAIVGLLAVGTAMPASVITTSKAAANVGAALSAPAEKTEDIQAYVSAPEEEAGLDRSLDYDVASMADIAADSGVTQFAGTWVSDPSAAIQWPFPVGVPISAAYGSQTYLSKFSSPHRGVDLTPGTGAEVHVVADGTVRIATQAGGDYGVTVVVDHVIDGQLVSTRIQ
ncbi:MAG: M23 family peptidase [Microbacterium sp.]|nr:MAG: M23 family peptidase [Microbacterium sp.]